MKKPNKKFNQEAKILVNQIEKVLFELSDSFVKNQHDKKDKLSKDQADTINKIKRLLEKSKFPNLNFDNKENYFLSLLNCFLKLLDGRDVAHDPNQELKRIIELQNNKINTLNEQNITLLNENTKLYDVNSMFCRVLNDVKPYVNNADFDKIVKDIKDNINEVNSSIREE